MNTVKSSKSLYRSSISLLALWHSKQINISFTVFYCRYIIGCICIYLFSLELPLVCLTALVPIILICLRNCADESVSAVFFRSENPIAKPCILVGENVFYSSPKENKYILLSYWIDHIFHTNCLLEDVFLGKIEGTGRRGKRSKQLLVYLTERTENWKTKH